MDTSRKHAKKYKQKVVPRVDKAGEKKSKARGVPV